MMHSMTQVFLSAFLLQTAEAAEYCLAVQTDPNGENFMATDDGSEQWMAQIVGCDQKGQKNDDDQDKYQMYFDSPHFPSFKYGESLQCLTIGEADDNSCRPVLVTECDKCKDMEQSGGLCNFGPIDGDLRVKIDNVEYRLGFPGSEDGGPAQYCKHELDDPHSVLNAGYSQDDKTIWLSKRLPTPPRDSDGTDRIRRSLLDQREQ